MRSKHLNAITRKLLFWTATLAAYAALSCGVALAVEPVSLVFNEDNGRYSLEGCFTVEADPEVVWQVLTDYDHIPSFVHDLKLSRVEEHWDNDLVLRQEAEGGFLFFTQKVHILLSVHEQPGKSIVFEDVEHKDFNFYRGSWHIKKSPEGAGLQITYNLTAGQKFSAPAFLASDAVHGGAQNLLNAVRRQILLVQEKKTAKTAAETELAKR